MVSVKPLSFIFLPHECNVETQDLLCDTVHRKNIMSMLCTHLCAPWQRGLCLWLYCVLPEETGHICKVVMSNPTMVLGGIYNEQFYRESNQTVLAQTIL
jgi:hypothetical protein